jgi:hypothetical protein
MTDTVASELVIKNDVESINKFIHEQLTTNKKIFKYICKLCMDLKKNKYFDNIMDNFRKYIDDKPELIEISNDTTLLNIEKISLYSEKYYMFELMICDVTIKVDNHVNYETNISVDDKFHTVIDTDLKGFNTYIKKRNKKMDKIYKKNNITCEQLSEYIWLFCNYIATIKSTNSVF